MWLFEQGLSALSRHTQVIFWAVAEFSQLPEQPVSLSLEQIVWQAQLWGFEICPLIMMCLINPSLSVLLMCSPLELAYKYGNLSEGVCKPGYAAAKMTTIYPKWGGLPFLKHVISDKLGGNVLVCLRVFNLNLEADSFLNLSNFTYTIGSFRNKSC